MTPAGTDTVPLSTYVEPEFADRVKALASARERSVAAEIRLALRDHLDTAELNGDGEREEAKP